MMLSLLADPSPFEAAYTAGVIVVLGGGLGALIAVLWHIWTRGD